MESEDTAEKQKFENMAQAAVYLREKYGSDIPDEDILDAFFSQAKQMFAIDPWPHQEEAVISLISSNHTVANTPTGSGKSLIALGMHFIAMCRGKKSFYTAPIKALVSEKFFDLVKIFGAENVGMITGDSHINASAPIICCTAEILANRALCEGEKADIGFAAMDEFHFYADAERGWAWQVPLITLPQTIFLLMSATLGDMTDICDSLEKKTGRKVDVISDAARPIPLEYKYVLTPLSQTVENELKKGNAPLYIVHFSQISAADTAQALSNSNVSTREQREQIKREIAGTKFSTAFGKNLRRLLLTGVGIHHAGMLPRYRRLVEQLSQKGLLPVICGTDTLGVGINVPIHTVVFTSLTKFDGNRTRKLKAREFHQIAGRAGRSGFDTEGMVIALAPEFEIENAVAFAKAASDPKKLKKLKKKKAPEGFVSWNEKTFDKLIESEPEKLNPHLKITNSIVLAEVSQGGNAYRRIKELINDSLQTSETKEKLINRAAEIFSTLIDSKVVESWEYDDGSIEYSTTVDLPDDFALDQPLSPFLLAAIELFDPESPDYALNVISAAEATLENPPQVLKAQKRKARDEAMREMKDDGIEYDERMERLEEVTYPQPLKDILEASFEKYCSDVPWAKDYSIEPKSVIRDMVETASDFSGYISRYAISRSEGTLLRYLSDAYRCLSRTIPRSKRNEQLEDITAWLAVVVRSIDSSLVDEWEKAAMLSRGTISGEETDNFALTAPSAEKNEIVKDRRGLSILIRNALFYRVCLMAADNPEELGQIDANQGMSFHDWDDVLEEFYKEHEGINIDANARSAKFFILDDSREHTEHVWHAKQIIDDYESDRDWAIEADIDLDAFESEGEIIFDNYKAGPAETLI